MSELKMVGTPPYIYVTKLNEAKEALEYLESLDSLEIDSEGTGLDPYLSKTTLVQVGAPDGVFVFDVRKDIGASEFDALIFKPIFVNKSIKKLFQNAAYDMKMIKHHYGFYPINIYDTMIAERLLTLGLTVGGASLGDLTLKYLKLALDKEPRGTFEDYNQVYKPYQIEYAARDVCILTPIMLAQKELIKQHGLEEVLRLELDFIRSLCDMELNGIKLDTDRWRKIMVEEAKEVERLQVEIANELSDTVDQITLFDIPSINIDSPLQLGKALKKRGIETDGTSEDELKKFAKVPLVANILEYRGSKKMISSFGESLLEKINSKTGRIHTSYNQMVSSGRLSSSNPNTQQIPAKQGIRQCFIAEEGCSILTADQSSAELRIIGNLSEDPTFKYCYDNNIDLHTKTASGVFNVSMEQARDKKYRTPAKAVAFGICYGMSKFGLAARLLISEDEAQNIITGYLKTYPAVAKFLEDSGKSGVRNRFTRSVSGRKRFYSIPTASDPLYTKICKSVERKAKNQPIQSSNADVIKQAMILLTKRLEELSYYAKLLLTVHDELVVECDSEHRYEVAKILEDSIKDGFSHYFTKIPMETTALISKCWMKGSCEAKVDGVECGGIEFDFIDDELTCLKCKNKVKLR